MRASACCFQGTAVSFLHLEPLSSAELYSPQWLRLVDGAVSLRMGIYVFSFLLLFNLCYNRRSYLCTWEHADHSRGEYEL